jgi:hypothetical protein
MCERLFALVLLAEIDVTVRLTRTFRAVVDLGGYVSGPVHHLRMGDVFLGSEALAAAALNEYQLRRWYRTIFRDVYVPKRDEPSLDDRVLGAWLWSRRRGVIAGVARVGVARCAVG